MKIPFLITLIMTFTFSVSETFAQNIIEYKIGDKVTSYTNIKGIGENLNAVKVNEKWGVVDVYRVLKTPIIYDYIYEFIYGTCKVGYYSGKSGYIDKNMNYVFQPIYDYLSNTYSKEYLAEKRSHADYDIIVGTISDKKWYFDLNGNKITELTFSSDSYQFIAGVAVVKKDNKWGMIDRTGKFIVPCIYKACYNYFRDNYNAVAFINDQNMCGFYNKDGVIIVPFSKQEYIHNSGYSGDEIPPFVRIAGKVQVVKNIKRLEPDYGIYLDESTINQENFQNSVLGKYYYAAINSTENNSSIVNNTTNTSSSAVNKSTQSTIKCNYQFKIPKVQFSYYDNRIMCKWCNNYYAQYSKLDMANERNRKLSKIMDVYLEKHFQETKADYDHKDFDKKRKEKFIAKNNMEYKYLEGQALSEFGRSIDSFEFITDIIFGSKEDLKKIAQYYIWSNFHSLQCENEYRKYNQ